MPSWARRFTCRPNRWCRRARSTRERISGRWASSCTSSSRVERAFRRGELPRSVHGRRDPTRAAAVHNGTDAPAGLDAVIARCLEKDRKKRYANVAELAVALAPFAPKRARASVGRISRVIQGAGLSDSPMALPPSSDPSTTHRARRRWRRGDRRIAKVRRHRAGRRNGGSDRARCRRHRGDVGAPKIRAGNSKVGARCGRETCDAGRRRFPRGSSDRRGRAGRAGNAGASSVGGCDDDVRARRVERRAAGTGAPTSGCIGSAPAQCFACHRSQSAGPRSTAGERAKSSEGAYETTRACRHRDLGAGSLVLVLGVRATQLDGSGARDTALRGCRKAHGGGQCGCRVPEIRREPTTRSAARHAASSG